MILCIDVGASRMKWGLVGPRGWVKQGAIGNADIGTLILRDWQNLPRPARVVGVNTAGEAQRVRLEGQLARWRASVEWIRPSGADGAKSGVVSDYRQGELAADRFALIVAARRRVLRDGAGAACVVVNAGTSVSIDALDAEGRLRGGVVLPGLRVMIEALAAVMPMARLTGGGFKPFPVNDADAAATGAIRAIAGAVEKTRATLDASQPVRAFVTGGAAQDVAPHIALPLDVVDNLVLEGVLALAEG